MPLSIHILSTNEQYSVYRREDAQFHRPDDLCSFKTRHTFSFKVGVLPGFTEVYSDYRQACHESLNTIARLSLRPKVREH